MISTGARQTGCASPGASLMGRTRWTRRSAFVYVPSRSTAAAAGRRTFGQRGKIIVNDETLHDQELKATQRGEQPRAGRIADFGGNPAGPVQGCDCAGFYGVNGLVKRGGVLAEHIADSLHVAATGPEHMETTALGIGDVAGDCGDRGYKRS